MNSSEISNNKEEDRPAFWKRVKTLFQTSPKTTEDMVAMVGAASENEVIDSDARRIIEGALEVSEMQARDIMVPRTQMVVLKSTDSFADNLSKIIKSGHSRYPVIGETIDDIQGILLSKDLLGLMAGKNRLNGSTSHTDLNETGGQQDFTPLLRSAVFVPESKRLNVLLKQFREKRNHMALVIDEYGSLAGLITIEDVLEEIVGEIEDEHDNDTDRQIRRLSSTHYVVDALTPIDDFNEHFDSALEDDEFDTIGGVVTHKFGHLPKRNESINIDGFTFHVVQADSRRLRMLRMVIDENIAPVPANDP